MFGNLLEAVTGAQDTVAYSQSPTISVERESGAVDIVRNLYRRRHLHRAFVRAR